MKKARFETGHQRKSNNYSNVESKLLHETKALQDKKREKYDKERDGPGKAAHTMGGNLLGVKMLS